MVRLVTLVERYGAAIEYDLHAVLGLDLLDFFRHVHTWRKLDTLLAQLPSGSAYWAARADDDEAAAALLAQQGNRRPAGSAAPALSEMSTTNQLLMDILDWQKITAQRVIQAAGGKGEHLTPTPRPTGAMARAKLAAEEQAVGDLVAEAYAAQARGGTLAPAEH